MTKTSFKESAERMPQIGADAIAGAVIGTLVGLVCACLCVRTWQRRRKQKYNFGLDPDERRFKRRLEQQSRALDGIFAVDVDEELELTSKEIEQLQALEQELARRASASQAHSAQNASDEAPSTPKQSSKSPVHANRSEVGEGSAVAQARHESHAEAELDAAIEAVAAGTDEADDSQRKAEADTASLTSNGMTDASARAQKGKKSKRR